MDTKKISTNPTVNFDNSAATILEKTFGMPLLRRKYVFPRIYNKTTNDVYRDLEELSQYLATDDTMSLQEAIVWFQDQAKEKIENSELTDRNRLQLLKDLGLFEENIKIIRQDLLALQFYKLYFSDIKNNITARMQKIFKNKNP